MDDLTQDDFLSGRLRIWQPRKGYRAGVDPVLLAASVPAVSGQQILELGCGVGVASLCLAKRCDVSVVGVERQADYADLALRNGNDNELDFQVYHCDLTDLPAELRDQTFDHVIANPPYYNRARSTAAQNASREMALGEDTTLAAWIKTATKRVAQKGYVSVIYRADRLEELLPLMARGLGSLELCPIYPRTGRNAKLVILRGRKGGRADMRLSSGVVMHDGAHEQDGDDYSAPISAVLRDGAALKF